MAEVTIALGVYVACALITAYLLGRYFDLAPPHEDDWRSFGPTPSTAGVAILWPLIIILAPVLLFAWALHKAAALGRKEAP